MKTYGRKPAKENTLKVENISPKPPATGKITDFLVKRTRLEEDSIDRKSSSPRKKSLDQPTQRQLFLDFGQRDLVYRECPECFMCYDTSFPEDCKRHRQCHSMRTAPLTLNSSLIDDALTGEHICSQFRYFCLGGEDIKQLQHLVNQINLRMEAVQQSATEISRLCIFVAVTAEVRRRSLGRSEQAGLESADTNFQVAAFLSTETRGSAEAFKASLVNEQIVPVGSDQMSSVSLVVSRIWTDPRWRRRGLAVGLLEMAR